MNKKDENKPKVEKFKLPRYLRLAKGSMFFDTEGKDASGVRIYAVKEVMIGREVELSEKLNKDGKRLAKATKIPEDKHGNKNLTDFGKIDSTLPWYIDTSKIDSNKLSRIITAFKYGILIEANPENPPEPIKPKDLEKNRDFTFKDNGDRIFSGKNKEMFVKLQNMNFKSLRDFIETSPKTQSSKENLMDLYSYELRGYNPMNRARIEVLSLLRNKLKEFGPGISSIRINED